MSLLVTLALLAFTQANSKPATVKDGSPWNGDWVLSPTRNTKAVMESAAEGYRFHITPQGAIRWEIPSLHEIVEGHTNGQPMAIDRRGPTGMTLAVTPESERTLRYVVVKGGKPLGEGRMTVIEQGQAWVDITQPFGRPDLAEVAIYERAPLPNK